MEQSRMPSNWCAVIFTHDGAASGTGALRQSSKIADRRRRTASALENDRARIETIATLPPLDSTYSNPVGREDVQLNDCPFGNALYNATIISCTRARFILRF